MSASSTHQADLLLRCPFCKGRFSTTTSTTDPTEEALLHSLPTCRTFDRLDPPSFLEAVRRRWRSRRGRSLS